MKYVIKKLFILYNNIGLKERGWISEVETITKGVIDNVTKVGMETQLFLFYVICP